MPRVAHAELLPGRGKLPLVAPLAAPVLLVPDALLAEVARVPDVQDWFISCSEVEGTRAAYLEHLARFLYWSQWTLNHIWELKREAIRAGEPLR